ncbi:hypothetical protein K227x_18500 [Rubripirellula lacrimiformis]|uniref:Uncharacterized protein n=1 Tax=Rubripirellula lacrimiformis TaxID=1930273 RepID=A0A517N8J7_9BACT|nr:hypothetical protein K227x_18500 [Rubripirellula lacrimiformis]
MPAAQSFNRVGNAPRAPDVKRAARWSRGETKVNDGRRAVMPAAQSFNRVGIAPRASAPKRAARWARG